jgi:hypothetical protein
MTKKQTALAAAEDLAASFLWYDRKEDPELTRDDLWALIRSGELTVAEIVAKFEKGLREAVP